MSFSTTIVGTNTPPQIWSSKKYGAHWGREWSICLWYFKSPACRRKCPGWVHGGRDNHFRKFRPNRWVILEKASQGGVSYRRNNRDSTFRHWLMMVKSQRLLLDWVGGGYTCHSASPPNSFLSIFFHPHCCFFSILTPVCCFVTRASTAPWFETVSARMHH